MLPRRLSAPLNELLRHSPAVVLLGPRQAGKTTLALEIGEQTPSAYLDLEDENDRAKLTNPSKYLADHEDELVILDEVHRVPELFQQLRGIIDRRRRRGKANGRFLVLGSAAMDLLKQSGESLAGRISYLELGPFDVLEIDPATLDKLWVRGGFPFRNVRFMDTMLRRLQVEKRGRTVVQRYTPIGQFPLGQVPIHIRVRLTVILSNF
jgi:predicted AAA+ superfamily ATPase